MHGCGQIRSFRSEFRGTLASLGFQFVPFDLHSSSCIWHHGGVLVVGQPWWKANAELAKINNVRAKPLAPVTMPAQSQGTEGCKEGLDAKPDYQIKYPTPIPANGA